MYIHKFEIYSSNNQFHNCGGRSVTKVIKVKLIGSAAHSRMQTCPRWLISD